MCSNRKTFDDVVMMDVRLWVGQGCRDDVTMATRYHNSVDSLLIGRGPGSSADTVSCVDDCFVMQYNQIFVGMITMQYQAKQVSWSDAVASVYVGGRHLSLRHT